MAVDSMLRRANRAQAGIQRLHDQALIGAERSRVGIPPSPGHGGTSRPDKCLVVKSLDSCLRPVSPSQHGIHRHHHQDNKRVEGGTLLGCHFGCPLPRRGRNQSVLLLVYRHEGRQSFYPLAAGLLVVSPQSFKPPNSKLTIIFFRSLHTSSRPMFTGVL